MVEVEVVGGRGLRLGSRNVYAWAWFSSGIILGRGRVQGIEVVQGGYTGPPVSHAVKISRTCVCWLRAPGYCRWVGVVRGCSGRGQSAGTLRSGCGQRVQWAWLWM